MAIFVIKVIVSVKVQVFFFAPLFTCLRQRIICALQLASILFLVRVCLVIIWGVDTVLLLTVTQ